MSTNTSAASRTTSSRPSATPTDSSACAASRASSAAKGDITALLDHLDHVIKKFGAEHAAIGCDVAYVSRFEKEERAKIRKRADGSTPLGSAGGRWEHLWPKDDFETTPEAEQSIAWTNWPLFTLGMVMRGHSDDAIRKVLGGNVMRVLQANTPA